jgi:hypothetical protein
VSDAVVERKMVGGRDATVSYLMRNFEPATRDSYEMLKVVWDNGDTAFLVREERAGSGVDPAH